MLAKLRVAIANLDAVAKLLTSGRSADQILQLLCSATRMIAPTSILSNVCARMRGGDRRSPRKRIAELLP